MLEQDSEGRFRFTPPGNDAKHLDDTLEPFELEGLEPTSAPLETGRGGLPWLALGLGAAALMSILLGVFVALQLPEAAPSFAVAAGTGKVIFGAKVTSPASKQTIAAQVVAADTAQVVEEQVVEEQVVEEQVVEEQVVASDAAQVVEEEVVPLDVVTVRARRQRPRAQQRARRAPRGAAVSGANVRAALLAVEPAVRGCATGRGGLARVRVTAGPSGRVRHASVQGDLAGTPQGSCIARVLRRVQLPRASTPHRVATHTFSL